MKPPASSLLLDRARATGLTDAIIRDLEAEVASRQKKRRKVVRRASLGAASLLFLLWAVPTYRSTDTLTTASAHRFTSTLPDGSLAELSAGTELETDFRYTRRHVHLLKGEAFFSVAKDPAHPFLVETPSGTVRVTGTHFNVRVGADSHAEVTLLEGSVRLDTAFPAAALVPGQQGDLEEASAPKIRTLSADELSNLTAWRKGMLVLDGLTLGQVAERLQSYHGVKIQLDSSVDALMPAGSCSLDDLPQILELLKSTGYIQVVSTPDGSYRISRR